MACRSRARLRERGYLARLRASRKLTVLMPRLVMRRVAALALLIYGFTSTVTPVLHALAESGGAEAHVGQADAQDGPATHDHLSCQICRALSLSRTPQHKASPIVQQQLTETPHRFNRTAALPAAVPLRPSSSPRAPPLA